MHMDSSSSIVFRYYNVMIVDDSLTMRNLIKKSLENNNNIKVAKEAENGFDAIKKFKEDQDIDLIILDHQMPIMDGIEALPKLLDINPKLKILMVAFPNSNFAVYGRAAITLGAADYIAKPNHDNSVENFAKNLNEQILKLIANMSPSKVKANFSPLGLGYLTKNLFNDSNIVLRSINPLFNPEIIAIASSTGGPRALMEVLGSFSDSFLASKIFFITQHIKRDFIDLLVNNINSLNKVSCKIAIDREETKPGLIYIAPSNKHMQILKNGSSYVIYLSDEPPYNFCKPSADPMFISLAKISKRVLGLVLTGIGCDGALGAKMIVENGGVVVAQDKESSVVWGMPGATANLGICSAILPLDKIAKFVEESFC